jgi:hypothetical protein
MGASLDLGVALKAFAACLDAGGLFVGSDEVESEPA